MPIMSILPHSIRIKYFKELELFFYLLAYTVFIIFSYVFDHFLIFPSLIACLVDYYWKRESDKILFKNKSD